MGAILEAIENNPKEIKRLLGIDQEQFGQLIAKTELLHKQKQEEIELKKLRVNKKGGGKKPKSGQLTDEQNQQNREFSQQRIFVEHVIRLIKIFNVARERFRLNYLNYKPVIRAICGLVTLRIKALILAC